MNEEVLAWKVIQDELVRDYFEAERIDLGWLGDINYLRLDDKKRIVVNVEDIEWTEKEVRKVFDSPIGLEVFSFCIESSDEREKFELKGMSAIEKKLGFEKIQSKFNETERKDLNHYLMKMTHLMLLSQSMNGTYFSTNLGRTFYEMIKTDSF